MGIKFLERRAQAKAVSQRYEDFKRVRLQLITMIAHVEDEDLPYFLSTCDRLGSVDEKTQQAWDAVRVEFRRIEREIINEPLYRDVNRGVHDADTRVELVAKHQAALVNQHADVARQQSYLDMVENQSRRPSFEQHVAVAAQKVANTERFLDAQPTYEALFTDGETTLGYFDDMIETMEQAISHMNELLDEARQLLNQIDPEYEYPDEGRSLEQVDEVGENIQTALGKMRGV